MIRALTDLMLSPLPLRTIFFRYLRKLKNKHFGGSYRYRTAFSEVERPEYGYCMYHAAAFAKAWGHDRVSVIEFGVANGEGLLNIEYHAENIKNELGVEFDIFGFDLETGLPPALDYRDRPHGWSEGQYSMDRESLEKKLGPSQLIFGDVAETARSFNEMHGEAGPIGAIMFDLDYCSSTLSAFEIFADGPASYLPRVMCYFDDIIGTNQFVGELRAIEEFNESNSMKKFAKPYGLDLVRPEPWIRQIFVFHDFEHPKYNQRLHTLADGLA